MTAGARGEWRSFTTDTGAQCAMVAGMTRTPGSYADSLVSPEEGPSSGLEAVLVTSGLI